MLLIVNKSYEKKHYLSSLNLIYSLLAYFSAIPQTVSRCHKYSLEQQCPTFVVVKFVFAFAISPFSTIYLKLLLAISTSLSALYAPSVTAYGVQVLQLTQFGVPCSQAVDGW